ncbi:hypothetical protein [Spirillospora sp. NBC_01491]|uniref:hypothetical protein n=1 Tax=Spirillospora sp. NBC_01491 TaxID=2976007 RepID=UPI002E2FB577|nr:hypothetical protein [Spirillospora sp. NBC_01491]
MSAELRDLLAGMAAREAHGELMAPPFVTTGGTGPSVRVRLVACTVCGAIGGDRRWPAPMRGTGDEPALSMLACERLTARAVLPIVVIVERFPELRGARFATRALAWTELTHLPPEKALWQLDLAERWVNGLAAAPDLTLPASTRSHGAGAGRPRRRQELAPYFVSPHARLPAWMGAHYQAERRAALLRRFGGEG